jgi:protein-S-isoprenylcysteine O-methyltransferase Ste14
MMNDLKLRIPPLALFIIFVVAIWAAGVYIPAANLAFPGHRTVALIAFILGWGIVSVGVVEFRRKKTTMSPLSPERTASIVSSGIYRWSRNPMYLGMALALFGVAAWRPSLPGYAAVLLFCTYLTWFQIKPEERTLLKLFGAEYSAYMAQVRRWI